MLIDEFLCKREVLGKRAPHSFTPPLSVVGVSNKLDGGNFLNKIAERNIVQLPNNHIPRGLVPLERIFDRNDVALKGEISEDDVDTTQCNIGIENGPKFVKLSRSLTKE
jgi:hypothetical protein